MSIHWMLVERYTIESYIFDVYQDGRLVLPNLSYHDARNLVYNHATRKDIITECYTSGRVALWTKQDWQTIAEDEKYVTLSSADA